MIVYVGRRLVQLIPMLLFVSLAVFALVRLIPGDPALVLAGPNAPREAIERLRDEMRLTEPLHIQIGTWYWNLFHGDLGYSFFLHRPVATALLERIPATLALTLGALLIVVGIGIPLGVCAAVYHNTWIDRFAMLFAAFGVSVPSFWLAIVLILVFSVYLGVLPAGSAMWTLLPLSVKLQSLVLPSIATAVMQAAIVARLTRSTMMDVLTQEYVKVAQAKGLPWGSVVFKHALRNALIAVVTVMGTIAIGIFGGLVVIETVFTIPGLGRLIVGAVLTRDYPIIQGALLFTAVFYSILNLLVDLSYGVIDPRIRYE